MDSNEEIMRKLRVADDQCPKCLGELDTGWECNDCGFDAKPIMDAMRIFDQTGEG